MLFLFGPDLQRINAAEGHDEGNDNQLAQAAKADPRAFTMLYERYFEQVYAYCRIRLNSREAAEDATSETFVKALARLDTYRNGMFAAWLFQIAHNTVIDVQRKRRAAPLPDEDIIADPQPTLEDAAIARARHEDLHTALKQLSPEQRTIIEMQVAGWSGPRIAATLGKSVTAVRMLRFRAVERLREVMTREDERR